MTKKLDCLWPQPQAVDVSDEFAVPSCVRLQDGHHPVGLEQDLRSISHLKISTDPGAYPITLKLDASLSRAQSYRLTMGRDGIIVSAADESDMAYGMQTLLQVLALFRDAERWPELEINDYPAYRKRCFMVDMGRSVFTMPLLKRIVRILARLKMNQLHVRLYDDELCAMRFEGFPFGSENPYALTIADLAELVRYAAQYHIEIVPELEAWGHVGSLVYHRPELRGGEGKYAGSSFLICEETFALMRELTRQVVEVMPSQATIHFGLDEANWYLAPSMPQDFSPEQLVGRYYKMLQEIGDKLDKELTMRIWADHGGRPVPQEIRHNVIIEPWQYWNALKSWIDRAIGRYSGEGKMRWMMGAGQSIGQYRGAYHATRYWCKQALDSPNVEGVNITLWGSNDLDQKLISLFAGAYFAWNPDSGISFSELEDYEEFDRHVFPFMYWWQDTFR
ncbi:MAG: family 20 glycosylhydrolase, partial [Candidatus Latescibacteria bacterium]|nr:family 20 glycosylhydrolase [Candidatus Latescibacterota bacterium]